MSKNDIIRAWKNPNYRNSLSDAQRALLPENPAGLIELSDADLDTVAGGSKLTVCTGSCCFITECTINPSPLHACNMC